MNEKTDNYLYKTTTIKICQCFLQNGIEQKQLQEILGIKERKFLTLVRQYWEDPHSFTIQYHIAGGIGDTRNEGKNKCEGNKNQIER